jgi:uncharacterized small protein (DUF1192 family)
LKDELTIQKRVNSALMVTIKENYQRIDQLRDEVQRVKARSWDIISERT